MHGFHGGFGFGLGFLNLIGMVLFFGFIFMLIKGFAYRMNGRRWGAGPGAYKVCSPQSWQRGHGMHGYMQGQETHSDAMQVARERFARGEMNQEQFETIKATLEKEQRPEPARPGPWAEPWGRPDAALELARLRFARGEIRLEEYEGIKKGLQG